MAHRAVMGLMFFPRGGSAQVTRALAHNLPAHGWEVTLVSGSLPGKGDAKRFFDGLDVRPVDYSAAIEADEPLKANPPMHPSYEDRPGAPDRIFAAVSDEDYEHLVDCWARELEAAGAADADVIHLHHLTPMFAAAERVAPEVPRIGHIHGTELLMLEEIEEGNPAGWPHAEAWAERMRRWARGCSKLIVLSPRQHERVERLLGVPPEGCEEIANGFDPARFDRMEVDRAAHWRRVLVEDPQGWSPDDEEAGSVGYDEEQIAPLLDAENPVLLYVGRFTKVKRVDLLIRAHARARERFDRPAPLVLLGGFPGEWEGEHPADVIAETGAKDVFLAGWHDHQALPEFFAACDAVVLPSVREQFGQVLVEGMACGLPAVAVDNHGPAEIVDAGETGWLVEPDDEDALVEALVAVVNEPDERRRRGACAHTAVRARYSWPALAGTVAWLYDSVMPAGLSRLR
jgi:glycosyltransferase involved in cell wall biosynthesis